MERENQEKIRVLYVDDIQANLLLFEASFHDIYDVVLAESGRAALDVLANQEIHVIVSDQNMPGMTGNELLEVVTSEYPDVMRFMITAYTDYETVVEAINKGHLYGFFNKPYNIEDVKHAIAQSVEVRNLRIKNRDMLRKLEKANEVMVRFDRSKTRFLNNVTDEIRNPINKIMTAVHMIKDKIDSEEITDLLNMLDVAVKRLESFSESTGHLVRLNDPDFMINRNDVNLKEIIEVGIIERGNSISNNKIGVKLAESAESLVLVGDYDLLQVSFSSLLGYIIEHLEKGSQLVLDIKSNGVAGELNITSDGFRFSESEETNMEMLDQEEHLSFDKDLRTELILAHEILTAHNGSIHFINSERTRGFTLNFRI